ncbi:porin [Piscinibacter sp.]|uniref:porin n=1 Tax=Piscinibacter sp. TaxID=1903157 RepID=UPI002B85913D|nr:porin [Albitalea sp.]HUG26307.1 porin [Albitalea sp.]
MKSQHYVLAAISFIAAAGAAQAQMTNGVTLYGVADAYVQVASGAEKLTRVQSGGLSGSRFGLKGSEDLGAGLRGIFTIESGINLDDGGVGQGAFWGRQAFVGLDSPIGQFTLGRQYGSVFNLSSDFSEFSNGPIGASTSVIGGFGGYEPVRGSADSATGNGGPSRVNNAIKYETPSLHGLKMGTLLGLGEVAGSTGNTRVFDVYARYTEGSLDAMVSIVDDRAEVSDLNVRTSSVGVAYKFDAARVTGGIVSVNDRSMANSDGKGYWVGGDYRIGVHQLKAQYLVNKVKSSDGKTQAFGAGYQYDLSKRTNLYSTLTHFKNKGDAYADRWATSLPVGMTSADDRNITEFVAGIRHTF